MNIKSKHGTAVHDADIHAMMKNWRKNRVVLRCGLTIEIVDNDSNSVGSWEYTLKYVTCFNCLRIINKDSILREIKIITGKIEGELQFA